MKPNSSPNHTRLFLLALCAILIGLAGCGSESPSPPTPTSTRASTLSPEKQAEYLETFEIVWQTVNERYFDPDFNGVDWAAVHDTYKPRITAAVDEKDFYITLNEMCFELGVSHFVVVPPGSTDLEPILSAPGTAGIDLRLIGDQAVITTVEARSPAEQAGLRPGFIITNIDDVAVADGEALVELWVPPFNKRRRQSQVLTAVLTQLYGQAGQTVSITYLDELDRSHIVDLVMAPRILEPYEGEGLPPMYVGYETRELEGGIAYLQLDGFLPPILEGALEAIQEMADAPAIIIDIRGNPGGFFPVRKAIASQFFEERILLWHFVTRPGLDLPGFELYAFSDPPAAPYLGPVVVLVDVLSGSSSEEFSGVMQANDRATIIGRRTTGSDLVADIIVLPNGATLLYPIAQTRTADGTVLEDRGVIPDITVELDRDDLLNGVDSQLQAAVDYLLGIAAVFGDE